MDDFIQKVWEELKQQCCADPDKAKRIVMLSRSDLAFAIKRAKAQGEQP